MLANLNLEDFFQMISRCDKFPTSYALDHHPAPAIPAGARSGRERSDRPDRPVFEDGAAGDSPPVGAISRQDGGQAVVRLRQIHIHLHQTAKGNLAQFFIPHFKEEKNMYRHL